MLLCNQYQLGMLQHGQKVSQREYGHNPWLWVNPHDHIG